MLARQLEIGNPVGGMSGKAARLSQCKKVGQRSVGGWLFISKTAMKAARAASFHGGQSQFRQFRLKSLVSPIDQTDAKLAGS